MIIDEKNLGREERNVEEELPPYEEHGENQVTHRVTNRAGHLVEGSCQNGSDSVNDSYGTYSGSQRRGPFKITLKRPLKRSEEAKSRSDPFHPPPSLSVNIGNSLLASSPPCANERRMTVMGLNGPQESLGNLYNTYGAPIPIFNNRQADLHTSGGVAYLSASNICVDTSDETRHFDSASLFTSINNTESDISSFDRFSNYGTDWGTLEIQHRGTSKRSPFSGIAGHLRQLIQSKTKSLVRRVPKCWPRGKKPKALGEGAQKIRESHLGLGVVLSRADEVANNNERREFSAAAPEIPTVARIAFGQRSSASTWLLTVKHIPETHGQWVDDREVLIAIDQLSLHLRSAADSHVEVKLSNSQTTSDTINSCIIFCPMDKENHLVIEL